VERRFWLAAMYTGTWFLGNGVQLRMVAASSFDWKSGTQFLDGVSHTVDDHFSVYCADPEEIVVVGAMVRGRRGRPKYSMGRPVPISGQDATSLFAGGKDWKRPGYEVYFAAATQSCSRNN